MENLPQTTSSTRSLTVVSEAGIQKALKYLASDQRPHSHTPLLPSHVCDAVIAKYSEIGPTTPDSAARKAVLVLLAGYPGAFTADPTERLPYMEKIAALFCQYPAWAVAKVIAPGFKFAGNPSFRPNDKEIADALDGVEADYRAYAIRARWHKEEGERRAKEAEWEANMANLTPERRQAIVEALCARPKEMPKEETPPSRRLTPDELKADLASCMARATPERIAEEVAKIEGSDKTPH